MMSEKNSVKDTIVAAFNQAFSEEFDKQKKEQKSSYFGQIAVFVVSIISSLVYAYFLYETQHSLALSLFFAIPTVAVLGLIATALDYFSERDLRRRVAAAEANIQIHPNNSKYLWDAARERLEIYLSRNQRHTGWVFWMTLGVIFAGLSVIFFGIYQAFNSADAKFELVAVTSISGIFVSFIGGTFLSVFRSLMSQSENMVLVLERINAVGMAMKVVEFIPESEATLKHATISGLAKQLLGMYSLKKEDDKKG